MIEEMIPESYKLQIEGEACSDRMQAIFYSLSRSIPILTYEIVSEHQPGLALKVLCHANFTDGVGRYLTEMFTRWMIPGKRIKNIAGLGLNFYFSGFPQQIFYFTEELFEFSCKEELYQALRSMPQLLDETRINILAVYQARYLGSLKSISYEHRSRLIQQNISSLFGETAPYGDRNAYDRIRDFLTKLSEEEKLGLIKENMNYLTHTRPRDFDRDIFYEISSFTSKLQDLFTAVRDPRHISRILAIHYLFKKNLTQAIQEEPNERHVNIKLIKSQLSNGTPVIGILLGMNLLKETERFDRKHFLSAIQSCLPDLQEVPGSFLVDRRDDKIKIFYLEMQKEEGTSFNTREVKSLRQELPLRLKKRIENIIHPIFMPRNEEEVLRMIVILSKQIKYLRDLPHLTIHYEKQTDTEITFLIVMVRVLKERDLPFKEMMQSSDPALQIMVDEIRSAGTLKKRFPKEAVVFRALLDKAPFFRKDFSLDLKRARKTVASELRVLLGEFRDFNGGMMHKQDEALEVLRKMIGEDASHHEILLENYFYSLRPGIMQTIHSPEILRSLFNLLLQVLNEDLLEKAFSLKVQGEGKYFLAMIGAAAPTFKEEVMSAVAQLKIPSYDLTTTFLGVQECATLGYILRADDLEKRSAFQQVLLDSMLKWKINFSCLVQCD